MSSSPTTELFKNLLNMSGISIKKFSEIANHLALDQMAESKERMRCILCQSSDQFEKVNRVYILNNRLFKNAFTSLQNAAKHPEGSNSPLLNYLIEHISRCKFMAKKKTHIFDEKSMKILELGYDYWNVLEAADKAVVSELMIKRYYESEKGKVKQDAIARLRWLICEGMPTLSNSKWKSVFLEGMSDEQLDSLLVQLFTSTEYVNMYIDKFIQDTIKRYMRDIGNAKCGQVVMRDSLYRIFEAVADIKRIDSVVLADASPVIGISANSVRYDAAPDSCDVMSQNNATTPKNMDQDSHESHARTDESGKFIDYGLLHDAIHTFYIENALLAELITADTNPSDAGRKIMWFIDYKIIPSMVKSNEYSFIQAFRDHEGLRRENPFSTNENARWLLIRCTHDDEELHSYFHKRLNGTQSSSEGE